MFPKISLGGLLAASVLAAPSAERSRSVGDTLFRQLPVEHTGLAVDNSYDDPRMWGELYRELTFGSMGTGVAAGDYDNDGFPDLFVVSKTRTSRLFRNLGGWKFEDVTSAAGLPDFAQAAGWWDRLWGHEKDPELKPWEQGATWADINDDGWLDLYVCRHGAPNRLYLNQGDGTFVEEAQMRGLGLVDGSGVGAFCDYDRDGDLDVYVQTNMMEYAKYPDGRADYLLRNRGDGFFDDVTRSAGIGGLTSGHSATWGDFNADGWPDLYVANDFAPPDQLYQNNGDGTFSDVINHAVPSMPFYGMGSDMADVDGDGTWDLLIADMAATSHEKDQRSMAGSRVRGQRHDENSPAPPSYMRNHLLLGAGQGRFREAAHLAGLSASDWTWSVRWEDFDHDGRVDLHITNGMNREYHGADLLERIMISENPAEPIRIMQESPPLRETNLAFRNLGELRFEPVAAAWGLDETGVSFGAATADFDRDGDIDIVYANHEGPPSVFRNDTTEGNWLMVELRGRTSNHFGVGAEVRIITAEGQQIRQIQPTRGYLSSSEPVAHFGLGKVKTVERVVVHWPSGMHTRLAEVSANQRLKLAEPQGAIQDHSSPPGGRYEDDAARFNLAWAAEESGGEEASGQPLLPWRFDRRAPLIAVGDYTGDGRADLVMGGTTANAPRLLVAGPDRRFSHAQAPLLGYDKGIAMGPIALFDADGDGRPDLLVTASGSDTLHPDEAYRPKLFFNRDGFIPAPPEAFPALPLRAGAVAVADMDRDGDQDIFIGTRSVPGRYPESPQSVLLRNEPNRFVADDRGLNEVGMVTAAAWVDGDEDGWLDLVVANDWGQVRFFCNVEGRVFEEVSDARGFDSGGKGWWRSLVAADFNGDGRPDLAAGNLGLNTPYQASREEPVEIHLGNFGRRRASPTLVEAYHEDGRQLPRRERKDLAGQIQGLQRTYRRTADYAAADLPELLGEENLAVAWRVEATQLESGTFLSQPDGRWQFSPFPRIAQLAPVQAMVTDDFDGDGHADLLLLQNDHSPIDLIGRFGGGWGQLLLGNGAGEFVAVAPDRSGVEVTGAATDAVLIDVDDDGTNEIFVTRNRGTSLLLKARPE